MNQLEELKLELLHSGFLENKPDLLLVNIPTEKDLMRGNLLRELNKNELFAFVYHPYHDIKVNTYFDTLYANQNIDAWVEINCILKYVSINPSYEINYIPAGHSALCLFEFENSMPELIKKLCFYGEKRNCEKHDTLTLTQREVLYKLIEEKRL